ncbi:MAG: ABC transporter ATP-binding protein/permease [Bryobacterales bacterium]|jgi:subfamily B ATP-binding cassette protein MsbA|nr:ABC transporter ATP-binding protein/permease [Bryobacterales bacterium]
MSRLRDLWPDIWALVRPRRGLLALGFVLMLLNRLSGLVLPASTKFLIDDILIAGDLAMLPALIGAVAGATMLQGVTSFSLTQLLSKEAQRLITEMRRRVQEHVGRLPIGYYNANKTGSLVSRIMSDVEGLRNLIGTGLVEFTGGLITALLAMVILFGISWRMTGVALLFVLLFSGALGKAFRHIRPIFKERRKIFGEVSGRLTESLSGVRVVKGFHAESREAAVFSEGVQRLQDNIFASLTAISAMSFGATAIVGAVGASVMYLGARQVAANEISVGDFVTFTAFIAFLIAPVFQIVGIGTQLTEAFAGLDRTREVLRERPEDEDPSRDTEMPPIAGHVQFRNVTFAYEPGKPVIRDVSFDAAPGTVTAFVGSSGSGKSTLINLIAAFHTPDSGEILVDGLPLRHVRLDSFRRQLGVVLQDNFLFDGSIRDNILFANPQVTEERFRQACTIARVDTFAEAYADGYDTIVGERGVKLSGGQKQRVSIARAILANPRLLILDEATSSLDSESEAIIQEGLEWLMQDRTTFVIAHRLSTIRRAHQILVVEDGRIVERGSHDELLLAAGRYHELYTRQHALERNLFLAPGEGDAVERSNPELV